jgi:hypothetical protein
MIVREIGKVRLASPPAEDILGLSPELATTIRLIGHTTMSFLGVRTGVVENGAISTVGWVLGIGAALFGVLDVIALAKKL